MNIDPYKQILEDIVKGIEHDKLRILSDFVVSDSAFLEGYGSSNKHHDYKYGLLVHTVEVCLNAKSVVYNNQLSVDMDTLMTGCLWHDYAKIWDYALDENLEIQKTKHHDQIHHANKGYAIFYKMATDMGLDDQLVEEIGHMIVSHHGDYGSIVQPETLLAKILHVSDMASAFCEQKKL